MHIAILLAGHTNKAMPQRFHDYDDMFTDLFQSLPYGKDFRYSTLPVVDNVFPDHVDDYDGFLISGSAFGVYDDAPFIPRLMDLVRQICNAKKPLVGVCFGHQIIAHALGGRAQRWDRGWGLGTINIKLFDLPDWLEEADLTDNQNQTVNLIHVHQDQVIELPAGARPIGSAFHCKNAAYMISDTVFSFQGHPEFDVPYTEALLSLLEDRAGRNCVAAARLSLLTPHDGRRVAKWILKFFARHARPQQKGNCS